MSTDKRHAARPTRNAMPLPAGAGETEGSTIIGMLRLIDERLKDLNERDNLTSFALAGGEEARDVPGIPPPRAIMASGSGTGVSGRLPGNQLVATAPQPPSVFQRLERCEAYGLDLEARISGLYSRVSDIERALFGESKG